MKVRSENRADGRQFWRLQGFWSAGVLVQYVKGHNRETAGNGNQIHGCSRTFMHHPG